MNFSVKSNSARQTREIAKSLVPFLSPGMIIGLSGELGMGKTEFVRGVVLELLPNQEVSSPSYVLENIYEDQRLNNNSGVLAVHHWDLYRTTESFSEFELGQISDIPGAIAMVEWPERVPWVLALIDFRIRFHSEPMSSLKFNPEQEQRVLVFEDFKKEGLGRTIKNAISQAMSAIGAG